MMTTNSGYTGLESTNFPSSVIPKPLQAEPSSFKVAAEYILGGFIFLLVYKHD